MNKRGDSGENVLWIARIIGTIVVIGLLVFVINGTIEESLDTDDLRYYSIAERFLFSPDCFIKTENTRAYPGIIETDKFNEDSIGNCMTPSKTPLGARLVLTQKDQETTIYYNQEYYEDILPLAFSDDYEAIEKRYLVLTEDLAPANLLIEVAWRK